MTTQGPPWIDYTHKDYASLRQAMLDLAQQRLPEWTDQSPNDVGVMLLELFAFMGDTLFYDQDRIAGESFLETARERRSVLQMLRLIGYELRPPQPASADLTLLFQSDATGSVTIPTGTQFTTTKESTGVPINFYYGESALVIPDLGSLPLYRVDANSRLTPSTGPSDPNAKYRVFRTLPVVQVDAAASDEIVGSSDGTGGQRFSLKRTPVIGDSLVVTVDEGTPVVWTRVASLLDSKPTDTHYAVRRDENDSTWIEFGDNQYGHAPRRGRNNIRATYLVGGGARGNVARGAISKIVQPINLLKRVLNENTSTGGADAEATEEAVLRGPQQYRSRGRAVTQADFEFHAKTLGVAKVQAQGRGWNRVELVVAPAGGGIASDTLKRDLVAYLDGKRMMTTQVEIVDPDYVDVTIAGDLHVLPQYFTKVVAQKAVDAVLGLWSFERVDFGEKLFLSKIYEVIEAVEGVESVFVSTFSIDPAIAALALDPHATVPPAIPADGSIAFSARQLPNVTVERVRLSPSGGLGHG